MSKAKFIEIIQAKDKNYPLELETKFNSFFIDYTFLGKTLFVGAIMRINKKTDIETNYKNFTNSKKFINAVKNVAKNKNIIIVGSAINQKPIF